MLGYITLGSNDLAAAQAFYSNLVPVIGGKELMRFSDSFIVYGVSLDKAGIAITNAYNGEPATPGNGNMAAIVVRDRAQVDALYNKAMELVINGLKLQPCQPGFVDGRDAILEANDLIFDGVDECLLWQVFARRGLGANAEQGNSNSRSDQTEDFSLPAFCTAGLSDFEIMESTVRIYPNPANDELTISIDPSTKIQSVNIVDVNGRLIKEISNLSQSTLSVDISNFNSGIYFVQLNSNGQQIIRKIVKN